jgi:hypothetical protein
MISLRFLFGSKASIPAMATVVLVSACAVLCSSRHQHQLVRRHLDEEHIPLFSWGYESWRNRMLSLP